MKFPSNPLYGEFLKEEECRTEVQYKQQFTDEVNNTGGMGGGTDLPSVDKRVPADPDDQAPRE